MNEINDVQVAFAFQTLEKTGARCVRNSIFLYIQIGFEVLPNQKGTVGGLEVVFVRIDQLSFTTVLCTFLLILHLRWFARVLRDKSASFLLKFAVWLPTIPSTMLLDNDRKVG